MSYDGELAAWASQAAARAEGELVEHLMRLTAVDAPSGDVDTLRAAAEAFAAELAELGGEVKRHERAGIPHLSTCLGPEGDGHVLILCHYDTVWPAGTAAERPGRVADGLVWGPGAFDMRGGIVEALGALRLLGPERLPAPVTVLLTGDEETGSESSRELILERARGASLVLVMEPPLPGGGLKTARKGWSVYGLEVSGRAAHAGLDPERGTSAIDELLEVLQRACALRSPESGTTVNIGTIRGGTRTNVVAAKASAELEIRTANTVEARRTSAAMRSLRTTREGAALEVTLRHSRPPMERTAEVAAAAELARELARALGFELREGSAGGTSDANLVTPLGIPVLDGLGPEGGGAHGLDEHIVVDSLVQRTALMMLLLANAGR